MVSIDKKLVSRPFLLALVIGLLLTSVCLHLGTVTARSETQIRTIKNITPKEAYTLVLKNKDNLDFVILDVRTPQEFAREHIEDAVNLDYHSETFKDDLDGLDKNKTYLVYCQIGVRSGNALRIMKELGFREVYNLTGGIKYWKAEGMPTTKYEG